MKKFFLYLLISSILTSCNFNNKETREPAKSFSDYGPAEYLWERWTYPNQTFHQKKFDAVINEIKLMKNRKSGEEVNWRVEGPLNIGGRVNVIAINPENDDELIIGTSSGGAFKTTDEGNSWQAIGNDFASMSIGAVAYDPQNTNIIYVGTGDPNISSTPKTGVGMYKSMDGGETWSFIGPEEVGIVSKILVHPTQSNILYMASMGTPYYEDENRGVYKSTDGGNTWEQVLFLSTQAGLSSLVFHPDYPDTLYAAGWDRIRNNQISLVSGEHARIYRSFDGGENWEELAGGLPQGVLTRAAVDVSMSNPAVLYASFVDPNSFEFEGIYRSNDFGDTWQQLSMNGVSDVLGGFGWYFGKIRIDPADENNVSVFGVELHSTFNGGSSWVQTTPDWYLYIVHADMHDLAYNSQGKIWLATDGGLYLGNEDFDNWEYRSYLPISQFYRITVDPHNNEVYAGGMQDNGTSAGNYQVDIWPRIFGGDGFQCIYDWNNEDIFYASTQNGGLVVYNGFNWDDFTNGIGNERVAWDAPLIMSSHNSNVLYTATTKVYKASNGPSSFWTSISDELTGPPIFYPANRHVVTTIAESPLNSNVLYAGTSDGRVWVSQNSGDNWTNITSGLPDRYVTDIVASDKVEGRVFVTHSGYKDGDNTPLMHASDNFGENWYSIAGDMPNVGINNIEIYSEALDSIYFAATDAGVFYTKNGGQNWEIAGSNMPDLLVFDIEIDYNANRLVAGTFARSIQTLSLDSLLSIYVDITETKNVNNIVIYPNPATDYFRIIADFDSNDTSWEIIDIQGKIVKRGERTDEAISVKDLKAGIYILSLSGSKTKFLKK